MKAVINKNILVTLLRNKTGRHVSGFPTEDDFILEMSDSALRVLSDEQIISSAEAKLRRAADHVLHSRDGRASVGRKGRFNWDDFIENVTEPTLTQFGMRRFKREEAIVRHIALAVDRDENLIPDLSDGHVYVYAGRKRRLVGTVSVDLLSGSLSGSFSESINPGERYVLAFKDHDELVPLTCDASSGAPRFRISENGAFSSKSEEAEL